MQAGSDKYLGADSTIVEIEKIFNHELFKPNYKPPDYDFALLKLKEPLIFSEKINAIALPAQDESVKTGAFVIVSGWGAVRGTNNIEKELRAATMNIVDPAKCASSWIDGDGEDGFILLTRQMVCAGARTNETDACNGRLSCSFFSDFV